MFNIKLIALNLYPKAKKILFATVICLSIISVSITTKHLPKKTFVSAEEELITLALDHNQCLGDGHTPNTSSYSNCMENLQSQRKLTVTL
jgi:hypothetical protein